MKYLLLSLLLLSGCSGTNYCESRITPTTNHRLKGDCYPEQLSRRVHPELQYGVSLFSADALNHNIPCQYTGTIGFTTTIPKDANPRTVGYCTSPVEVRFIKSFWEKSSATNRLVLMYHELGHCALGLDHVDSEADIMNSYLLDEVYAEQEWDNLVEKMFRRAKR